MCRIRGERGEGGHDQPDFLQIDGTSEHHCGSVGISGVSVGGETGLAMRQVVGVMTTLLTCYPVGASSIVTCGEVPNQPGPSTCVSNSPTSALWYPLSSLACRMPPLAPAKTLDPSPYSLQFNGCVGLHDASHAGHHSHNTHHIFTKAAEISRPHCLRHADTHCCIPTLVYLSLTVTTRMQRTSRTHPTHVETLVHAGFWSYSVQKFGATWHW